MKYLNENGLQVVADKINTRLKTVTEMPLTANDGAVRLYVGTDGTYLKGHIYKMVSNIYHMWRVSSRIVYTKGRTPSVGDIIYDWDGTVYTDSGYTVVEVDGTNYITSSNGMTYGDYGTQGEENWTDITSDSGTADLNFDPVSENAQSGIAVSQALKQVVDENTKTDWEDAPWSGDFTGYGSRIWIDGDNVYCSDGGSQYALNRLTNTWEEKTWYGFTELNGEYIWTDGTNVYYSSEAKQYVLNRGTSTWETKTWQGLTELHGHSIWTDGTNIYYSYGSDQYVLDKATSTWEPKTWYGYNTLSGSDIWTDGINIYYSSDSDQYVLNKSTSTWEEKTWNGLSGFRGHDVWSDGTNIYYSYYDVYTLDEETSTWEITNPWGSYIMQASYIWKFEDSIYVSGGDYEQKQMIRTIK